MIGVLLPRNFYADAAGPQKVETWKLSFSVEYPDGGKRLRELLSVSQSGARRALAEQKTYYEGVGARVVKSTVTYNGWIDKYIYRQLSAD